MKLSKQQTTMDCNDIIKSVFELNKLDVEVYKNLEKYKKSQAKTLAQKMHKERSTVYRSLQKLTACGLCTKKTKTITTGGYYHLYELNDLQEIKNLLEACIDTWYTKMKQTLQGFEQNIA
jgi:predicted transcriptional regulator